MFYLNLTHPEIQKFFAGLYEIETSERDGATVKSIKLNNDEIQRILGAWNDMLQREYINEDPEKQQAQRNMRKLMLLMLSLKEQESSLRERGQVADDIQEINNYLVRLQSDFNLDALVRRYNYYDAFGFEELLLAILFAAEAASAGEIDDEPTIIDGTLNRLLSASFVLEGKRRGNMLLLAQLLIDHKHANNKNKAEVIEERPSKFRLIADRLVAGGMLIMVVALFVGGVFLLAPMHTALALPVIAALSLTLGACMAVAIFMLIVRPIKHLSIRQKRDIMIQKAETNKIIIPEAIKARNGLRERLGLSKMVDLRVPGEVVIAPVEAITDPIVSTSNYRAEPPHATDTLVRRKRLEFKTNMRPPSQLPRQLLRRSLPSEAKTMLYLQGVFRSLDLANWIGTFDNCLRRFRSVTLFSAQQKIAHLNNSDKSLSAEESAVLAPDEKYAIWLRNLAARKLVK